jgi:hypothetical protein
MNMSKTTIVALIMMLGLMGATTKPSEIIGEIDFFGYQGLDLEKLKAVLLVHVGDQLSKNTKGMIEDSVSAVIGKMPTDVAEVCCDQNGHSMLYIGLAGKTYKPFDLNPAPLKNVQLPAEIVSLQQQVEEGIFAAVRKGGDAANEDDSQGYMLVKDPATRALQMQERNWALAHGPELLRVLKSSSDDRQREVASSVLGYAQQSHEQIVALVAASRDPNSTVRNNTTRALGVLVRSNSKLADEIDPQTFLAMLGSGTWTDHNKAVSLLEPMSMGRDPKLLAKIREQALEPLIEMALWSEAGHAYSARVVLGRIGGIPEEKLKLMAFFGPVDEIVAAARGK